jgi:hypothetical protein
MLPALVSYRFLPGYDPTDDGRTSLWPDGSDFAAEYARSDRSTCRLCQKRIAQNELRFSVYVENFSSDQYKCTLWHHFDCFFTIEDALHLVDPHRQLRGLNTLSVDDRHRVDRKIAAFQTMYAATKVALENQFARTRQIAETGESDDDSDEAIVIGSNEKQTRQPAPAEVEAGTLMTKTASRGTVPTSAKSSKAKATNPAAEANSYEESNCEESSREETVKAVPRAVKANSGLPATTAAKRASRTTVGKKKAARK